VGTAKRERQKANRQARLEQLAREARVRKSKRVGMRTSIVVLLVVGVVAAVYFVGGDDSPESSTGTAVTIDTTAPGDTTVVSDPAPTCPTSTTVPGSAAPASTPAPTTTIAYAKPAVQIPAAIPTELQVTTLKDGTGPAAKTCDELLVHYVGVRSADGVEFDNSYDRGSAFPVTLGVTSLIQGWTDGLVGVQAGGQYQLDIPASLAYGDVGSGDVIRPGDAITFVVDIVSVTPAA
jgi:peptidylprolyl isomerase